MRRLVAFAFALLALALPACGGDDDGESEAVDSSRPGVADRARTTVEESRPTTAQSAAEEGAPSRDDETPDGGEGDDGQGPGEPRPPSRAEYIRAADRICRSAQAAIARSSAEYRDVYRALAQGRIGREEYSRRGGELSERTGEIAQRAVAELRELPPPTSRREAVAAYLHGAAAQAALLTRQGQALREGRIEQVASLDRRVGRANRRTRGAARRVGFRVCGGT